MKKRKEKQTTKAAIKSHLTHKHLNYKIETKLKRSPEQEKPHHQILTRWQNDKQLPGNQESPMTPIPNDIKSLSFKTGHDWLEPLTEKAL